MRAKDKVGLQGMILGGQVIALDSGTKCRVIDHHIFKGVYEVRVLSGPYLGQSGFVDDEAVKVE